MTIAKRPFAGMQFGCLLLFSLPFAAVGTGMAVWIVFNLAASVRMASWVETPAKVLCAELKVHSDSEGGDSYEATAEYEYQYGGRKYVGHRVAIDGMADNMGSFQQDAHRRLSEHQKTGRPFRCFVNPANPAEAVLFRELRWEIIGLKTIFVLAFGTGGFGLLSFAVIGMRKQRTEKRLAAARPDQPWLWRPDWADGRIRSANKVYLAVAWAFTIFWNSISSSVFFILLYQKNIPSLFYLFLLFPLIGAAMLVWAIVSTVRWFKYGASVFQMAAVPGVIGGQLAGVIHVRAKLQPPDGFRLALKCLRQGAESETVLWADEQVVARQLRQADPVRTAVPVLFNIPYECQETGGSPATRWRLEVKGGVYRATFEVPVFKTAASDPNFVPDRKAIADYAPPEDPEGDLRRAGVLKTASPTGEGCRLIFPMARTPLAATVFTLVGLIFGAVPLLIYHLASESAFITVPMMVIFGLLGLLLLVAALETWLYRSVVDVSRQGLTIVGGILGLGRRRRIEASEIEKITLNSRLSSGEGADKKSYYDIDVICKSGKKLTAGKRILGKHLAESVVRQIEQAMRDGPAPSEMKIIDG